MERPEGPEPVDEIGFQVRTLSHAIKHMADQMTQTDELEVPVTGIQGRILGYLYQNRDRDVFQRDIQEHFSVRRSTVTGILQLMEKNGLIVRQSVAWDARLKKLELTPRAMRLHEDVMRGIHRTEEALSATLTAQEKATFIRLCQKIKNGMKDRQAAGNP